MSEARCGRRRPLRRAAAVALLLATAAAAPAADGQGVRLEEHVRLDKPAELSRTQAIDFYESIVDRMQRGYALSHEPAAIHYRRWHLYNDAPYRSETHGNRYVNNYANIVARRAGYGRLEPGERMPPGAILAKDSLTVMDLGERLPGALFIMEKLAAGRSPQTADWRYVMIMPDGSYFGDTLGVSPDAVAFCHECHEKRADTDYLYFLPKEFDWTTSPE